MKRRTSKMLVVEGKDDAIVIANLCEENGIPESFRISAGINEDRTGYDCIWEDVPRLFEIAGLTHVGIVVDADADPAARWRSLSDRLRASVALDLPDAPDPAGTIRKAPNGPTIGLWMMPDNTRPGMLEDFFQTLIPAEDTLLLHARETVDALPDHAFSEAHTQKAVVHTWLAWQAEPGTPMGLSITRKYADGRHPSAEPLIRWLRALFEVEPAPVPA